MLHKRAYFAHAIRNDRYIYVIGGRGDSAMTKFSNFTYSQSTMERYDNETNRWVELECTLMEGRYHSTACIFQNRYIYVFGGYKTEAFYGKVAYKVSRKHEKLSNVRSDFLEMYDTEQDTVYRNHGNPNGASSSDDDDF